MAGKIKHCLIIPGASAIVEPCIIRIVSCGIAACPAASVFFPKTGIVCIPASYRNPRSFPVEHADHTDFIRIRTDIADHGRLTLYGCRISVDRTFDTVKAVAETVAVLGCVCVRGLSNHNSLTVFIHNVSCNVLHILIGSVPERIVGQAKHIIVYIVLLQIRSHGINLIIVRNVCIMHCYLNVFVIVFCTFTYCFASCCQKFHNRCHIGLARHSVVDLVPNLYHADIDPRIKNLL